MADQPLAVIDTPQGGKPESAERDGWSRIGHDLATLWQAWFSDEEKTAWLHVNHLGAVEAATGQDGKLVWRARYQPFGKASIASEGFVLNLRLPGQYEDAETGLHYNRHRYYDPQRGAYLTPDPLGVPDGPNPYLYVRGNPLKYIDPSGLVLFAFDGTGNGESPPAGDSISNVLKFYQAYDQDINGPGYYITGIGTTNQDMPYKGNMANGDGFDQRVKLGFDFLDEFIATVAGTDTVDIDVIGFSRGAAEARVWVNQLVGKLNNGAYSANGKSRCINLRFEGLWDTVPHLGWIGGNEDNYDFGIPAQVKYAAHAVALNEHRGFPVSFHGRSIMGSPGQANTSTRIELGFIGSHADIGGGYGTGDLSDVALMWMVQQAKNQGIQLKDKAIDDNGWNTVTTPIVHDKSDNKIAPGEAPLYGDRNFIYGDGTTVKQTAANVAGRTTADAVSAVNYYSMWCGTSDNPAVGVIDTTKYNDWLQSYGFNIQFAAPPNHPC